ncbi:MULTISPECIES: hypothetical protein [Paenibacillus]|uniref:IrrE N-terminal-like domain-containing protein n=1 Tax=Paenibacillus vandeheii TaxID=3035917 RepID=A0ABT8JG59_9BACL|nr:MULTISPECIES: hypothetical protein [Paenibacillus]KGP81925.1 hypothetical protein P364_0113945 [Paenibacillus sp. MAEPY2]KGP87357.1 hypothetical protein P363_0112445 [Paenibacillus sp. MAEPY1]MDN4603838.1 hypothetical protein [Paenibacillus vandeheii]
MEPIFNFDKEMIVTFTNGHSRPYKYFWYEDIVVMHAKEFGHAFAMHRFSFDGAIEAGDQFIDKSFIVLNDTKKDKDNLLCTFYNELGHIKLNHLKDYDGLERAEAMARGDVYYAELEADKFAFDKMGKSKTTRWLESVLDWLGNHVTAREQEEELRGLSEKGKKALEDYRMAHLEVMKRLEVVKGL